MGYAYLFDSCQWLTISFTVYRIAMLISNIAEGEVAQLIAASLNELNVPMGIKPLLYNLRQVHWSEYRKKYPISLNLDGLLPD